MLYKFLSLNTLKGDFSNNSKAAKTTTSQIEELWIFLFWNLNCSFGRSDQFQADDLLINRRQICTSAMCANLITNSKENGYPS